MLLWTISSNVIDTAVFPVPRSALKGVDLFNLGSGAGRNRFKFVGRHARDVVLTDGSRQVLEPLDLRIAPVHQVPVLVPLHDSKLFGPTPSSVGVLIHVGRVDSEKTYIVIAPGHGLHDLSVKDVRKG